MHFDVHSKYFYSKLDSSGKKVYERILAGWLNYEEEVTVSGITGSVDYNNIITYLFEDIPELFYIDTNRISTRRAPSATTVYMQLRYSKSRCEQIKQEIADVISQVKRLCKPGSDKERVIHDYLVQNVTYATVKHTADVHNIKGALVDGSAVCEGYAMAFKLLCDAVEIPCIVVSGTATDHDGSGGPHAWNIVRRNKKNYHVDVTWDRGVNSALGVPLYFNLPDEYISKDHTWQKNKWPSCTDFSEADQLAFPVYGKKSLREVFINMSSIKKPVFAVRFNRKFDSSQELTSIIREVISEAKIKLASYQTSYHSTIDCAIIRFNYRADNSPIPGFSGLYG